MGSIYKITNTVNGKAYIGKTTRDAEKTRIRYHLAGNRNGSQLIKDDIEKYGKDVFTYEILHDGIIPEFLDDLEREAIARFNTVAPDGYNLDTGGGGGKKPSEETRRKQSEAQKGEKNHQYGKPLSPETRRKISEAKKGEKNQNYGKPRSEETKRKISEAQKGEKNHRYGKPSPNRGKPHSAETCRKISETLTGKPLSPEHRQRISEATKGEKSYQYGKPLSPETRRKISEAKQTPKGVAAREFFFSLPSDMNLKEKRKRLRQKFPEKHNGTIYNWCKKFDAEI